MFKNKLNIRVPCQLIYKKKIIDRISIREAWAKRYEFDPFLKGMMIRDKKMGHMRQQSG